MRMRMRMRIGEMLILRSAGVGTVLALLAVMVGPGTWVEGMAEGALGSPKLIADRDASGAWWLRIDGLPLLTLPDGGAEPGTPATEWDRRIRLSVVTGSSVEVSRPPILGTFRWGAGPRSVVFQPRFSLQPGLRYQARISGPLTELAEGRAAGLPSEVLYRPEVVIPAPDRTPQTVVAAVYPSAEVLPENLLKFYLHFSGPMSQGAAYRNIKLLRSDGSEVEAPFLELDEELWNRAGDRLTVFIDPGRIKNGLLPREEAGPALEFGGEYELIVEDSWLDAERRRLKEPFVKAFRVTEFDAEPPHMSGWKLRVPRAGSTDALSIEFPEPMDHALLQRLIWVVALNKDSQAGLELVELVEVAGRVEVLDHERVWALHPEQPWQAGRYEVRATNVLEDLAGNGLGRAFEVDLFETVQRRIEDREFSLAFDVR